MRVSAVLFLIVLAAGHALAEEIICFEAESADSVEAPMVEMVASASKNQSTNKVVKGASGERYLEIAQGKGSPAKVQGGGATYTFSVSGDGTYVLWARVWWDDECGNSFGMSVDGAKPFSFGQDGTFRCWHWVKGPRRLKQLELKKGTHTLKVMNREDGVRLDQILLTTDRRYVPVGIERTSASE